MNVVQDLFAVVAAADLQFPYLGIVLIGAGVVLVCIGVIFWRRASRPGAIEQPTEDAASDAPEGNPQEK
jgi:hypothetical protein